MKFGIADYGMNVWDGGLYDIRERLAMLKSLGYDGIERVEAVSEADALSKAALYRRMGMDFSTCRGPSVQVGIDWTAGLGKDYVWLTPGQADRKVSMKDFIRRSNKFVKCCSAAGIKAAIHNHMDMRIQDQDEVDKFMKDCPEARLLFDVGHLIAAGGDCIKTLKTYSKRIVALHLKDVILEDGGKYSFHEMGSGNASFDFDRFFAEVKRTGFAGEWIFVEQDCHTKEPKVQLAQNFKFMQQHGLISK